MEWSLSYFRVAAENVEFVPSLSVCRNWLLPPGRRPVCSCVRAEGGGGWAEVRVGYRVRFWRSLNTDETSL